MHEFLLSPSALGKKKGQRERKEKLMTNEHEPQQTMTGNSDERD